MIQSLIEIILCKLTQKNKFYKNLSNIKRDLEICGEII
jgi:hypothetical protein